MSNPTITHAEAAEQLTWEGLTKLAPGLATVLAVAKAIQPGRRFCANEAWGDVFRPAVRAALRECEIPGPAWKPEAVCRAVIWPALPDCHRCRCVDVAAVIASRLAAAKT